MQGKHINGIVMSQKGTGRPSTGLLLVPGFCPANNHVRIRVRLFHAQGKSVYSTNHLGNIERRHITNVTRFCLHTGNNARKVTHLVNSAKIRRHIPGIRQAGRMEKLYIRVLDSHILNVRPQLERIRHDNLCACGNEAFHHFFRSSICRNPFAEHDVQIQLLSGLSHSLIMRLSPAMVFDRAVHNHGDSCLFAGNVRILLFHIEREQSCYNHSKD